MPHTPDRAPLPPRALALVTASIVLLASSTAVYLSELPSLMGASAPVAQPAAKVEKDDEPAAQGDAAVEGSVSEGDGVGEDEALSEGSGSEDGQNDSVALPNVTLEGVTLPEVTAPSQEGDAPEASPEDTGGAGDTSGAESDPGDEGMRPGAGNGSQDANPSPPQQDPQDDIPSSTPTAEEEQAFRQFLLNKASLIPDYASQAGACASSFQSDSVSADLSTRRAHQGSCTALKGQLLSEYIALRDYPRSNSSQYCDEQGRLIGAYRCLTSYVACYAEAWDINVSFDDPSAHVDEFTGPAQGAPAHLEEFHSYYDGLAI